MSFIQKEHICLYNAPFYGKHQEQSTAVMELLVSEYPSAPKTRNPSPDQEHHKAVSPQKSLFKMSFFTHCR